MYKLCIKNTHFELCSKLKISPMTGMGTDFISSNFKSLSDLFQFLVISFFSKIFNFKYIQIQKFENCLYNISLQFFSIKQHNINGFFNRSVKWFQSYISEITTFLRMISTPRKTFQIEAAKLKNTLIAFQKYLIKCNCKNSTPLRISCNFLF